MTIQTLPGASQILMPPPIWHTASYSTSMLLDAAGERGAFSLPVPRTGNISHVGIRVGTVTASADLKVSLQSGTAGNPSGTILGATNNAFGVIVAPAANTFYEVALGEVAAVTRDDQLYIVVEWNGAAGNLTINTYFSGNNVSTDNRAWWNLYTGAAWSTKSTQTCLPISLKYNDGYYPGYMMPTASMSGGALTNATAPDEVGNLFSLPYPVSVSGIAVFAEMDGPAELVLYEGNTVLGTIVFDENDRAGLGINLHRCYFVANINLAANTNYRVVLKPTSTTSCAIQRYTAPSAAMLGCYPMDSMFALTSRTDAGAWTDTTDQLASISIIAQGFDDGAGAGGGPGPRILTPVGASHFQI